MGLDECIMTYIYHHVIQNISTVLKILCHSPSLLHPTPWFIYCLLILSLLSCHSWDQLTFWTSFSLSFLIPALVTFLILIAVLCHHHLFESKLIFRVHSTFSMKLTLISTLCSSAGNNYNLQWPFICTAWDSEHFPPSAIVIHVPFLFWAFNFSKTCIPPWNLVDAQQTLVE